MRKLFVLRVTNGFWPCMTGVFGLRSTFEEVEKEGMKGKIVKSEIV